MLHQRTPAAFSASSVDVIEAISIYLTFTFLVFFFNQPLHQNTTFVEVYIECLSLNALTAGNRISFSVATLKHAEHLRSAAAVRSFKLGLKNVIVARVFPISETLC